MYTDINIVNIIFLNLNKSGPGLTPSPIARDYVKADSYMFQNGLKEEVVYCKEPSQCMFGYKNHESERPSNTKAIIYFYRLEKREVSVTQGLSTKVPSRAFTFQRVNTNNWTCTSSTCICIHLVSAPSKSLLILTQIICTSPYLPSYSIHQKWPLSLPLLPSPRDYLLCWIYLLYWIN